MILLPQTTCRDLVLMASDYSAAVPDVQSTAPRDDIGSVALPLGQASRRSAGKKCKKGWNGGNGEASSRLNVLVWTASHPHGSMALSASQLDERKV
jgi:hypothetical protein